MICKRCGTELVYKKSVDAGYCVACVAYKTVSEITDAQLGLRCSVCNAYSHDASVHKPVSEAQARKDTPIYSGVIKYFPLALAEIARVSKVGGEQHSPGQPLAWDRSKSGDELDALTRHLVDAGKIDTDGTRHSAKLAWRALANLEKELEKAK